MMKVMALLGLACAPHLAQCADCSSRKNATDCAGTTDGGYFCFWQSDVCKKTDERAPVHAGATSNTTKKTSNDEPDKDKDGDAAPPLPTFDGPHFSDTTPPLPTLPALPVLTTFAPNPLGLTAVAHNLDTSSCVMNAGDAIDQVLDAAVYIWAATERCGQSGRTSGVRCEIDIASAIQAISGTADNVIAMLMACGYLQSAGAACATSVGQLTGSVAGFAASSGKIDMECNPDVTSGNLTLPTSEPVLKMRTSMAKCFVDIASSAKTIFKAATRLKDIVADCGDPRGQLCIRNEMNIIGAVSSLGAFLGGAADHCEQTAHINNNPHGHPKAACSNAILSLIASVNFAAKGGMKIADSCVPNEAAERLYLESAATQPPTFQSANLAFVVLLPLTAVLSFVGGSRLHGPRRRSADEHVGYQVQGSSEFLEGGLE